MSEENKINCPYCRKLCDRSDFINPLKPNKAYKSCHYCRKSALEFYQINKERILQKCKNKDETCECGCQFNSITRHVHLRSKTHINFIKNKLQLETADEAKSLIKQTNDQRKIDKTKIIKTPKPPKPPKCLEFYCDICNIKVKGCSTKAHLSTKMHSRCLSFNEERERLLKQIGRGSDDAESEDVPIKKISTDMLELLQRGDDD